MSTTHYSDLAFVILAAGKGTRMKSSLPKVLHEVGRQPMIAHVLRAAQSFQPKHLVVVTEHQAELVEHCIDAYAPEAVCVRQGMPNGTGHAVQQAMPQLEGFEGTVVILYGDAPLVTAHDVELLLDIHKDERHAVTVMSAFTDSPEGLGRIVRDDDGKLSHIVEEKDCTQEEREITEVNTGIYAVDARYLSALLGALDNDNSQGEYYLTDIIAIAQNKGMKAGAAAAPQADTLLGANDRVQLSDMEWLFQQRKREEMMLAGVTLIDPATTYFSADTQIEADVIIEPGCVFAKGVKIASGTKILAHSYLEQCVVGEGCTVGPFARLRPGAELAEGVKVGNFVEIKKAHIGQGSKVNHLSYVGDATVGAGVNIGAGTIFANYHSIRKEKNKTIVKDHASLGANSVLVAPVEVGEGSFIGAGTTLRHNTADGSLVVSKSQTIEKQNYAQLQSEKQKTA